MKPQGRCARAAYRARHLLPHSGHRRRQRGTSLSWALSVSFWSTAVSSALKMPATPHLYGQRGLDARNLDRRVELVSPIEDEIQKARAFGILDTMLSDTTNARFMQRVIQATSTLTCAAKKKISSQLTFYHEAQARLERAAVHRKGQRFNPDPLRRRIKLA